MVVMSLDAEQVREFVLPLADQRLGYDQQNALNTLHTALGDNQPRLDRFPKANFVGENAAALPETPERKDNRVDLVGIQIDARLSLRGCVALPVVRPANTH